MIHDICLKALDSARRGDAIEILMDAFLRDPTMRWCFGARQNGYDSRLLAYLEAGHDFHVSLGQPVHGAFAGDRLLGVVYVMMPEVEIPDAALEGLRSRLMEGCGVESAQRFFRYHEAMDARSPRGPSHLLAVVGVRERAMGQGVGARLVGWAGDLCDAHASSLGVCLDTGNDRNVLFYERLGYRVIGEERFDDLVERLMFRPRCPS